MMFCARPVIIGSVSIPGTYQGFVEEDDITRGTTDVVVTDDLKYRA